MAYSVVWKGAVAFGLPLALLGCASDDGGAAATVGGTVSGGTVSGGTAPTGGGPTDSADTTNPPPTGGTPVGSCCEEHPTPDCNPFSVSSCVCNERPYCCMFDWDASCVDVATNSCNGCGPVEDSGTTGVVGEGDCCRANGTPGCTDPRVQACVCADNAACCDAGWDGTCVEIAAGMCDAGCATGTDTGSGSGSGSESGSTNASESGTAGGASSGSSSGTAG